MKMKSNFSLVWLLAGLLTTPLLYVTAIKDSGSLVSFDGFCALLMAATGGLLVYCLYEKQFIQFGQTLKQDCYRFKKDPLYRASILSLLNVVVLVLTIDCFDLNASQQKAVIIESILCLIVITLVYVKKGRVTLMPDARKRPR